LRERRAGGHQRLVDGVPFEDVLTGYGVVVAAETALRLRRGGCLAFPKVSRSLAWPTPEGRLAGFGRLAVAVRREVWSAAADPVAERRCRRRAQC